MPSVSLAQHRFFNAIKHNKRFAGKTGVPQAVAREFLAADKARGKSALRRLPERAHRQSRTIATGNR